MNKIMKKMQDVFTPIANFIGGERHFAAMQQGMMLTISFILVSAIFMILANPPVTADLISKGGFWKIFSGWYNFSQAYKVTLLIPFNMTMGLISVICVFGISYNLAVSYKMSGVTAGITSIVLFLLIAAPATYYPLANKGTIQAISTKYLGAEGMFTSILVGLLSVEITRFFMVHKLTIKLPDVVPSSLSVTFSNLIPLLANVMVFWGANLIISAFDPTLTLPSAIEKILAAPVSAVNSVPGALLLCVFILLLWGVGVHGMMVVMPLTTPITMAAFASNAALYASGHAPVFEPIFMTQAITFLGGTGCTLGFSILCCTLSKSKQLKAIGKATIVPSVFRISEPVIFGAPIIFNPILIIPFILGSLAVAIFYWLGCIANLITPVYIMVSGTFPIFINSFIKCLDYRVIVFEIIMIPVLLIIWYPFFKVYDNQLAKKEMNAENAIEQATEEAEKV